MEQLRKSVAWSLIRIAIYLDPKVANDLVRMFFTIMGKDTAAQVDIK